MFIHRHNNSRILIVLVLLIFTTLTHDHSGTHEHDHQGHQHHHTHDHDHYHQHQHEHQHHTHSHDHHHDHEHQHQDHSHTHEDQSHHQHHTNRVQPHLQMITDKPRLLQTLKLTPITVFFYGNNTSPEYQQFTKVIPAYNDQFFSKIPTQLQFAYISSDKFKLARPNPSLSIYRNINNGEWLMYRGIFDKTQMLKWITGNIMDPLKQLSGQEIDALFVDGKKGFLLLDFGQFYLLKPKIMLSQFCTKFELLCGKVSHTNRALNMVVQLMRAQKQPGVPKLGYWNPKTQQLQIYTKDVGHITGHESVIPYQAEMDVAKVIHPETEFIEVKQPNMEL